MRSLVLDGSTITDRQTLHQALAQTLSLPDWYGGNLDALFDALTSLPEETLLVLRHWDVLEQTLGPYAQRLLRVLKNAEAETNRLTLQWEP